jgi:hypothetical protein
MSELSGTCEDNEHGSRTALDKLGRLVKDDG